MPVALFRPSPTECREPPAIARILLIAAISAVMCLGCGGGPPKDDIPPLPPLDTAPVAIDQYVREIVEADCRLAVRCGVVDDLATCESQDLGVNPRADLVAGVKAGKVIFHGDKARECLNAPERAGTCDRSHFVFSVEQTLTCLAVFEGTVAGLGACAFNEECISQRCDKSMCSGDPCCIGRCDSAPPPRFVNVGQSCARDYCLDGYCDFTTTTCRAYLPPGASCSRSEACQEGLACDQTCQVPPGPGEPCHDNNCGQIGTTCSTTSSTCVALGLLGDVCRSNDDCSPLYRCSDAACALEPQLGEACTGSCGDHSFCDPNTKRCTAPQPNGASCMGNSWCQSGWCDDVNSHTCIDRPICI